MAFVYILEDQKGKYYIGSTTSIKRRLSEHGSGHTHSTHRMNDPVLVFFQEYDNLEQARKIEYKLKSLKRKDYIEKVIEDGYIKMLG